MIGYLLASASQVRILSLSILFDFFAPNLSQGYLKHAGSGLKRWFITAVWWRLKWKVGQMRCLVVNFRCIIDQRHLQENWYDPSPLPRLGILTKAPWLNDFKTHTVANRLFVFKVCWLLHILDDYAAVGMEAKTRKCPREGRLFSETRRVSTLLLGRKTKA